MTLQPDYRGRLAPSPTGDLHVGHVRAFWLAYQRALEHDGTLILRLEDLDPQRSRAEYAASFVEDLSWLGIRWQEGYDIGGTFAPYQQSARREFYLATWRELLNGGYLYPCICSRKDLAQSASAPHETLPSTNPPSAIRNPQSDEPLYPGICRGREITREMRREPRGVNWRFRVPDGARIEFTDWKQGAQGFTAGADFGDFVVWRRDDVPAYQLAVVADDAAMRITEVVRGADLLLSAARQILLQRALGLLTPAYYHCDLVTDERGERLAKRHAALSVRALRAAGVSARDVIRQAIGE